MRAHLVAVLIVVACACAPATATAQEPQRRGWSYLNVLAGRANPVGLGDELRLRYRLPLYDSASPVTSQNFVGLVPSLAVSPVYARPGLGVELQPATVLHLYAGYEPAFFFGSFDTLRTYPSPRSQYPSDAFNGPSNDDGRSAAAVIHQVMLAATVQARVGPIALRSGSRLRYAVAATRGDPVYYDGVEDILVPRRGLTFANDTDLVYLNDDGLVLGVRFAMAQTWYPGSAYLPGEPHDAESGRNVRLGPLVAYTFDKDPSRNAFVHSQTLALLTGWYIAHRYRTGEFTSAALPYLALAYVVDGTL